MILRALPDANKDFARGGFFGGWVNGRKSGSGGGSKNAMYPSEYTVLHGNTCIDPDVICDNAQ